MTLGIVNDASRELELGYSHFKGRFSLVSMSDGGTDGSVQILSTTPSLYAKPAAMVAMQAISSNGSLVKTGCVPMAFAQLQVATAGVLTNSKCSVYLSVSVASFSVCIFHVNYAGFQDTDC
jgi:hypothetical protein